MAAALAAGLIVLGGCFGVAAQERPQPATPCGGATLARGIGMRAVDGRTFVLDDGREVRLAGIEVPPLSAAQTSGTVSAGAAAQDALADMVEGADIELKQAEPEQNDRYGRLVAYAFIVQAGGQRLVQADLLAAGIARVAARAGSHACAAELLGREAAARRGKLGLWGGSYYDLLSAENPDHVLAALGRFALIEGQVVSVRESGATIYVNFGRQWSRDFTVTISKRNVRSFAAAGLEPKTLAGRRVRVRGWIEQRGGPWIEASRPEQIEIAERE